MKRANELGQLIGRGLDLVAEERDLFLGGRFDGLGQLTERKQDFLADLEAIATRVRAGEAERDALARLLEDSRRNERLIGAARAGLKSAQRKVEAILAARKGAVAYDPNGEVIASRVDAMGKTKQA